MRQLGAGARFSKVPKSHSKIENLMITELFYSHILIQTEVPFIQEASGVYVCSFLDTDELKMALWAIKDFGAFEKRAPSQVVSS